jgi:hypothetical protein
VAWKTVPDPQLPSVDEGSKIGTRRTAGSPALHDGGSGK